MRKPSTPLLLGAATAAAAAAWVLWRRRRQQRHTPRPLPPRMAAVAASLTREQLNYALVEFRGVPVNPSFDVATLERLTAEFATRATDCFVNSYPKAGTTWTQTICFHAIYDLPAVSSSLTMYPST